MAACSWCQWGPEGEMDESKTFVFDELWEELQVFLSGRDGEL